MKILFRIFILLVLVVANAMAEPSTNLITALIQVESEGRICIGDNGQAVGILQIHKILIDDINRFSDVKFTYADRIDPVKSIQICRIYLNYYGNKYQLTTGKVPSDEVYARIWNKGPKGYLNPNSVRYWDKVQLRLKELHEVE